MATTATGLVHGFAMLIAVRMVLGAAESVAFPSYSKIICLHVPQQHRGMANAVIMAGMSAGPAIGAYGCGMSMARYGWRPVFIVLGLVSLIWVAPWLRWMPKTTIKEQRVTATISAAGIFRQRSFWGASIGHFCIAYPWYFILLWLPLYLVRERHQSMQDMSLHAALFFVIYALVAPITGFIADACIRAGADVTIVRKTFMAIGHGLVVIGVLAAPHPMHGCLSPAYWLWAVVWALLGRTSLPSHKLLLDLQRLASGSPCRTRWATSLVLSSGRLPA